MSSELAIRSARAIFNKALADGDLAAIRPLLAPGVVLIAGSDSALISGRKAQLDAWRREFGWSDRTIYSRMCSKVLVSPVEPIAFEHGDWTGTSTTDGERIASGVYTAKWRNFDMKWMIEAEVFLTMA